MCKASPYQPQVLLPPTQHGTIAEQKQPSLSSVVAYLGAITARGMLVLASYSSRVVMAPGVGGGGDDVSGFCVLVPAGGLERVAADAAVNLAAACNDEHEQLEDMEGQTAARDFHRSWQQLLADESRIEDMVLELVVA